MNSAHITLRLRASSGKCVAEQSRHHRLRWCRDPRM